MKAIILAGGYATRLWPLTKERAKPLLLLNGKPLMTHIVDKIPEDMDIIVSTNKRFGKDFRNWKKNLGEQGARVTIRCENSDSEDKKLGAIGAVVECIQRYDIKEDVFVVGGDNFFGFSFEKFLQNYKGIPMLAAYNIGSLAKAKRFGVLNIRGSKVIKFQEKPENPTSTLVNTFCSVIPQSTFHYLFHFAKTYSDNYGEYITYLLKKKIDVQAWVTTKEWFDIGSFEGYIDAHKTVEREKEHRGHYMGVDFWGKNTLKGKVFIDKGTIVRDSILKDCIILSNCDITNSKIKNCIIDEEVTVRNCGLAYEMVERGRRVNCKNSKKCRIKRS